MRLGGQDVEIEPGTLAYFLFKQDAARARFRHRYEVDPLYLERLEAGGLIFSGRHPTQPIMQILELPPVGKETGPAGGHPYFIAAQFHPELTGRPQRPQPMFMGLVAAALHKKLGQAAFDVPEIARWLRPVEQPETQPA